MQVNNRQRGTAIPTVCHRFCAFSRHFALSESNMTAGSDFDLINRVFAAGFLLESGFVAVYLHALGHFSL